MRLLILALLCLSASPAQAYLIGVQFHLVPENLSTWRIDPVSRLAEPLGSAGISELNAMAQRSDGALVVVGVEARYDPYHQIDVGYQVLAELDPVTGRARPLVDLSLRVTSYKGLAYSPEDVLYAVHDTSGTFHSTLAMIDATTGAVTRIGMMAFSVTALTFAPDGRLFAWGGTPLGGYGLLEVDPATGAAMPIGPVTAQPFVQGLTFVPGGGLLGISTEIYDIDIATGVAVSRGSLVVPPPRTLIPSIRGIGLWPLPEPSTALLGALALAALACSGGARTR